MQTATAPMYASQARRFGKAEAGINNSRGSGQTLNLHRLHIANTSAVTVRKRALTECSRA